VLRVGLTGGLGSGKSTAARMFAEHEAYVFSADEIARTLMQPGQDVYAAIVEQFGSAVVRADGSLDRPMLARMAFDGGRLEELEAIVHPATIARQAKLIEEVAAHDANAVTIVESALIFQTKFSPEQTTYDSEKTKSDGIGGWASRFDRIIFVQASVELKITRFVARSSGGRALSHEQRATLEAEARRRLAQQAEGDRNAQRCDYVLTNDGSPDQLRAQVDALWPELKELARCAANSRGSLQ
jgi:dephospho-CoA kinase